MPPATDALTRALLPLAAMLLAILAALVAMESRPARACSIAEFGARGLKPAFEEASIVALGTFEQPERDTVILRVEEHLKGAREGDRIEVNNHQFALGADCSLYLDEDSPGRRFAEGERVLIFLEPDEFGMADWRPSHLGYGVLAVEHDALFAPFRTAPGGDWETLPTVDELRALVEAYRDAPPIEDYEYQGACASDDERPVAYLPATMDSAPEFTRMAPVIVRGRIAAGDSATTTLEVEEYWKGGGSPGTTLTVNNAYMWDPTNTCEPVLDPATRFPHDREVVAFLQPDEFQVGADVRPVAWMRAVFAVRDGHIVPYPGLPLLSEVRALAGDTTEPAAQPETPAVAETAAEEAAPDDTMPSIDTGGDSPTPLLAAGALGIVILATGSVAIFVRRR